MPNYRFNPKDFTTRLQQAYYSPQLDMTPSTIWNFEAVGNLPPGQYTLKLTFTQPLTQLRIALFHEDFQNITLDKSSATFFITIDHDMLSFHLDCENNNGDHHTNDKLPCPLTDVQLIDLCHPNQEPTPYIFYQRNTRIEQCNLLNDWPNAHQRIMSEDFDLNELTAMRDELRDWSANRQVTDPNDPHYGAIYSEEDKYSYTDAIFAACVFMRTYRRTNNCQWLDRALAARDYAYKGQYRNTGDTGKDGAWSSMGIIDTPLGKNYRRITDPWSISSGVDTGIITRATLSLCKMKMPFSSQQLDQLHASVTWQIRNQLCPGWFSHHEGMDKTCINMNSLGAVNIFAVHEIMQITQGRGLSRDTLNDAIRACEHVFDCQEAIGLVPYRRGDYQRGGAYWTRNLPDNGMGTYHLMGVLTSPHSPYSIANCAPYLRKLALWYLLTSRFENDRLILDYDPSESYFRQCVGFGNFTWCRITMIDIISQLWNHIGDQKFWQQFIRAHLKTIRQTLSNHNDPNTAPIKASLVPQNVVSWMQQAQWAALVFDNLAIRYGLENDVES